MCDRMSLPYTVAVGECRFRLHWAWCDRMSLACVCVSYESVSYVCESCVSVSCVCITAHSVFLFRSVLLHWSMSHLLIFFFWLEHVLSAEFVRGRAYEHMQVGRGDGSIALYHTDSTEPIRTFSNFAQVFSVHVCIAACMSLV